MAAVFSPCGRYRYVLTREWLGGDGTLCWVLLNPSTATETVDDPTIRRCRNFAQRWGYQRLVVVNLFALRSTDPAALKRAADPVGPDNDRHIGEQALVAAESGGPVVCAWGNRGGYLSRAAAVRALLERAGVISGHLGLTGQGQPGHPLYLPADRKFLLWMAASSVAEEAKPWATLTG